MEDLPKVNSRESSDDFGKTRLIMRPVSTEELSPVNDVFKKFENQLVKVRVESETFDDSDVIENDWRVVGVEGKMIKVTKEVQDDKIRTITKYVTLKEFELLNPLD